MLFTVRPLYYKHPFLLIILITLSTPNNFTHDHKSYSHSPTHNNIIYKNRIHCQHITFSTLATLTLWAQHIRMNNMADNTNTRVNNRKYVRQVVMYLSRMHAVDRMTACPNEKNNSQSNPIQLLAGHVKESNE